MSGRANPLVCRSLNPDEADAARSILKAAFAPYVARLGRAPDPQRYAALGDTIAAGRAFGGYLDTALVAVAVTDRLAGGAWRVDDLAVHPDRQGGGLGAAMLAHVVGLARAADAPAVRLHTASMMTDLLRFYAAQGFRVTHQGPALHGKDAHPRSFMELRLTRSEQHQPQHQRDHPDAGDPGEPERREPQQPPPHQ